MLGVLLELIDQGMDFLPSVDRARVCYYSRSVLTSNCGQTIRFVRAASQVNGLSHHTSLRLVWPDGLDGRVQLV